MIAHHEVPVLRHLIRELDVALTQRQLSHVRLIKLDAVDGDAAFLVNVNPAAGARDHALHQHLVVVIERHDVPLLEVSGLERQDR